MRVGAQVATKGKAVKIPAGSLVTFRLEKPLHAGVADAGFSRNGKHFHRGFGIEEVNTRPYEAGLQSGRLDRQNRRLFDRRSNVWSGAELFEYHAGYQRGFEETPGPIPAGNSIRIGADHYIRWSGPPDSRVFVKVDGQKRLFSTENSGAHPAPWMRPGRKYVFTLVDQNGKELAKDENDLTISRGNTMD
jgi:hypothetical protein